MPQAYGNTRQRFPNLSKLGIAILENFVEKTIGEAAVEEVKRPYAEKQIADSLGQALEKVEADFQEHCNDRDVRDRLLQLPVHDLPSVLDALWAFSKNPNDPGFAKQLKVQLMTIKALSQDQIESAVNLYMSLLRRELVSVDPEIRAKLQADAVIKSEEILDKQTKILEDIRDGLGSRPVLHQREQENQVHKIPPEHEPGKGQSAMTILPPPFLWLPIPAGEITLGGKNGANGGYITQATIFDVAAFDIAKYPITNSQFQVFIDDADGYHQPARWSYSSDALTWYQRNKKPYAIDSKSLPDHPRVYVSWYEAIAFCLWLSEKTGEHILLPTDQQWQRAAQGETKWAYPYGDRFYQNRCNFHTSGTTVVNKYEGKGDSPFGVVDMSGNIWEWCLTNYGTGDQNLEGSAQYRVLRGGSWRNRVEDWLRTDYRNYKDPGTRYNNKGFRLVRL